MVDVVWKIVAAVGMGFVVGRGITAVNQHIPEPFRFSQSNNGLASVGVALLVYGLTEAAHCYGFVAVFTAACTIRNTTKNLGYTRDIHSSAEQLVMVLVLSLFGGAIAEGLIFPVSLGEIGFALIVLFLVRPFVLLLSFIRSGRPMPVRLAAGFFGIRGLGSLYYTIYAINQGHVEDPDRHWRITGIIVLMSVVIYGISAHPVKNFLDKLRERHKARD